MKLFNLEKALSGAPVVTRKGAPVTDFHYFAKSTDKHKLFAVVDGEVRTFTEDGVYFEWERDLDLFMAPVRVEKWAVIYKVPGESPVMAHGELFATEEEAIKRSKELPLARGVARVEWEE